MEPLSPALELAYKVKHLFEGKGDVGVEEIRKLLHDYSSNPEYEGDWRQYCFGNDIHYTRNLIYANDTFELMVLYWKPGQETRIHNHSASRCWASTLAGETTESVYITYYPPGEADNSTVCPDLILTEKLVHKVGDVGYIEDDIGIHKLGNKSTDSDAVTLHLYSPPILELTLYEPERKSVSTRRPGFYSIGGKKTSNMHG